MAYAPIALFVYNRLDHTEQTIQALLENKEAAMSELFIFSDAPNSAEQASKVQEIRNFINKIVGFKCISIIEQQSNLGLSNSIINGVSEILKDYDKIIVLEDDLVVAPYFLDYMNRALNMYESDESIASIHGYVYPLTVNVPPLFFLKGADCWGWATWKRGWHLFEPDGKKLAQQLRDKQLIREFNFDDTYPYYQMLLDQINGSNNSWAIRWYASCFLANKLTLYPGKSFVFNIGLDNSGTHCFDTDSYNTEVNLQPVKDFNIEVTENNEAREAFKDFFERSRLTAIPEISLLNRIVNKVKSLVTK